MGKFEAYNIHIKQLPLGKSEIEYHLTNDYFSLFDEEEIQKGDVAARVSVSKTADATDLAFALDGMVIVTCDRCLDEMEQPIHTTGHLVVRLGDSYSDDGDDTVIVPEEQGVINVAWFLHEFVTLAMPLKHVHAYGLCNKGMKAKLDELLVGGEDDATGYGDADDDGGDGTIDPRWSALQSLKE